MVELQCFRCSLALSILFCTVAAIVRVSWGMVDEIRSRGPRRVGEIARMEFYGNISNAYGHQHHCKPRHVHISLHHDSDKMIVMWETKHGGCESTVLYSHEDNVDPANLDAWPALFTRSNPGVEDSVQADDMCSSPAKEYDYDTLYLHSVVLHDLRPSEHYWYCPTLSKHCFKLQAPPLPSTDFSFVVYGDMGESDDFRAKSPGAMDIAEAVKDEVLENGVDLIVHIGDVSYADGDPAVWHAFFDAVEPYAALVPYMVGIGNHDYDYKGSNRNDPSDADPYHPEWGNYKADSGGECGVALVKRFDMLYQKEDMQQHNHNAPFWYSYNYGNTHFVVISTEHDLVRHSEQWSWLQDDLRAVDRCTTPWLVVNMHRPMYVIKPHHANVRVGEHLRAHLEDMFFKYGVDVVTSGHVHSFSRSCPAYEEKCVAHERGGITHVIAGSGGHKLSRIKRKQWEWVDYAERKFGYARINVKALDNGDSEMSISYVRGEDGNTRNTITLTSDLRRRGICSYCYSRSDGVPPLAVQATCDTSKDLDAMFDIRFPPKDPESLFFRHPMTVADFAATSVEMDESSYDDDLAHLRDADSIDDVQVYTRSDNSDSSADITAHSSSEALGLRIPDANVPLKAYRVRAMPS